MNKKELARFRKMIEEEKGKVLLKLGVIGQEISDRSARAGAGQAYSNHMADIGSDAMEQEQAFIHASKESEYLRELDDALKRIDKGIYGKCDECGGTIPVKRLEAYLAVSLCIDCKSKQEKLHRS